VSAADLAALAAELAGLGLRPVAGFATHPHWDHLLWSRALGDVPRHAAPAAAAAALAGRDELTAELRAAAPGHDLDLFARISALPAGAAAVPWDGPRAIPIIHNGHAPGHAALFLPRAGVLVAGDMLSDVEIPLLDLAGADPYGDYVAGFGLLAAVAGVRWIVPGHGAVGDAVEFARRVRQDQRYLGLLAAGRPFDDPRARPAWQRAHHEQQRQRVAAKAG